MNTASTTTFINTTLSTVCQNCTTQHTGGSSSGGGISVETVIRIELGILIPIFIGAVFGNILLITSIATFRHLRSISNYMILHLAICDLITAMVSITFTLVYRQFSSYPFGVFGCKVIWPLATYTTNASVLTLVTIAFERFIAIYGFSFRFTKAKLLILISAIHVIAVATVTPYSYHLKLTEYQGTTYCHETWIGTNGQKGYTIFLFLLQYGIPLPTLISLYSLSWFKIRNQNKKMIELSEEYEQKMGLENEENNRRNTVRSETSVTFDSESNKSTVSLAVEETEQSKQTSTNHIQEKKANHSEKDNKSPNRPSSLESAPVWTDTNNEINSHSKKHSTSTDLNGNPKKHSTGSGSSATSTVQRRVRKNNRTSFSGTFRRSETLKSIRTKFHTLRKPKFKSQTAYIRHKQTVRTLTMFTTVVTVFLIFALPNQITWLVKDFMPADKQPRLEVLLVFNFLTYASSLVNCWIYGGFNKHFRKAYKKILRCHYDGAATSRLRSLTNTTALPSTADTAQNDKLESRNNAFTDMFQQHLNHFEQFQHLYYNVDETVEEEELIKPSPKPKRKLTFSNLLNVLSPSSNSSTKSRKYSLMPPIIPFTTDTNLERRSRASSVTDKVRKASVVSIAGPLLQPSSCQQVLNISSKKRRASTPARYALTMEEAQPAALQPTRPRKTSVFQALVPNFLKNSVRMEVDVPEIKVLDENNTYLPDENTEVQEVQTVEIKAQNISRINRVNAKRGKQFIRPQILSTKMSPKMARKLSASHKRELTLHTISEVSTRTHSTYDVQIQKSNSVDSKPMIINNGPEVQTVELSKQPALCSRKKCQFAKVEEVKNYMKPKTDLQTVRVTNNSPTQYDIHNTLIPFNNVKDVGIKQLSPKCSPLIQRKAEFLAKVNTDTRKANRNSLNLLKANKIVSQRKNGSIHTSIPHLQPKRTQFTINTENSNSIIQKTDVDNLPNQTQSMKVEDNNERSTVANYVCKTDTDIKSANQSSVLIHTKQKSTETKSNGTTPTVTEVDADDIKNSQHKVIGSTGMNKPTQSRLNRFKKSSMKKTMETHVPNAQTGYFSTAVQSSIGKSPPTFSRRTKLTDHVLAKKLNAENV